MLFAAHWGVKLLRWIYRRLEARRTAVASVSTVIGLLLLSLVVPQQSDFSPREFAGLIEAKPWLLWAHRARLTDIYRSAPMLAAFTVLLVNLWLSFASRLEHMRAELRVKARPASPPMLAREPIYRQAALPADAERPLEELSDFLRSKGYRTDLANGSLRAVRNRFSVLGSVLFHLSFLILLIAIALRAATGFHGVLVVGEGDAFDGRPAAYTSTKPRFMPAARYPDVHFRLVKFTPSYSAQNTVIDSQALVEIDGAPATVRVNYPMIFGTTSVRLVEYGFAPLFVIRETDKRLEHRAAIRMLLLPPGKPDAFVFPALPVTFTTRLYPDYRERHGVALNGGAQLTNPAAILNFIDGEGKPQELLLFARTTKRVGRLEFEMPTVSYWVRFEANRDAGRVPMYVSLLLGLVGLAWRMLLPRKRIDAVIERTSAGDLLHVAGFPDYTREPFATEFGNLLDAFLSVSFRYNTPHP